MGLGGGDAWRGDARTRSHRARTLLLDAPIAVPSIASDCPLPDKVEERRVWLVGGCAACSRSTYGIDSTYDPLVRHARPPPLKFQRDELEFRGFKRQAVPYPREREADGVQ